MNWIKKIVLKWLLKDVDPVFLGAFVIDKIIEGKLVSVDVRLKQVVVLSTEDVETMFIWSANANEQIGSTIKGYLSETSVP